MGALPTPRDVKSFELGGVELAGGAFKVLNGRQFTFRAPKARSNVTAADEPAELGRRSRRRAVTRDLEVLVTGLVDEEGDPPAVDPVDQADDNEAFLRLATLDAAEDDEGCITLDIELANGDEFSGSVQVDDFVPGPGTTERVVVMQITIPAGQLDPVET